MESTLFLIFILYLSAVHGKLRPYDIDDEALRLFGTDLSGALARFRRTQDYAKILDDKFSELVTIVRDVSTQGLNFHEKDFKNEAVGIAEKIPKFKRILVDPQQRLSDVNILDRHLTVYQRRPIKIRNQVRNRGFELASQVIDTCMDALTPVPAPNARKHHHYIHQAKKDKKKEIMKKMTARIDNVYDE